MMIDAASGTTPVSRRTQPCLRNFAW